LSKTPQFWSDNLVEPHGIEEDDEDDDSVILDDLDNSLNSTSSKKFLNDKDNNSQKVVISQTSNTLLQLDKDENKERNRPPNNSASNGVSEIVKESKQVMANIICNFLFYYSKSKINPNPHDFLKGQEDKQACNENEKSSILVEPIETIVAIQQVKQMIANVNETYPELAIPGHILYIYRIHDQTNRRPCRSLISKLTVCCKKSNSLGEFDFRWATREEFKKILITNRTLIDHFPNSVEDALKYFSVSVTNNYVNQA
jgi:hypothetical protein